jgi:hypothetical protein
MLLPRLTSLYSPGLPVIARIFFSIKKMFSSKSAAKLLQIFEMYKILTEKVIDLHSKKKISLKSSVLAQGSFIG